MSHLHVHLLLLVSVLVAFVGPTFAVTVPCNPDSSLVSKEWRSLIDFPKNENNCGFDGPNGTVPPDHCKDFGSFGESQSGTPFKDPCNSNTTIDEIEVTVGLVGSSSMIRSIQTTYSDGSVYSHGQPTNESYTINFKQEKLYTIAAYVFVEEEVIKGVAFLATDHSFSLLCAFGPIGPKVFPQDDWNYKLGAVNAFYGSAGVGINSLGYFGCRPIH